MLHHASVLCDDELNLFSFIVPCDLTTIPTLGESIRRDWRLEMASPGNERKDKEASNCPVARTHYIYFNRLKRGFEDYLGREMDTDVLR